MPKYEEISGNFVVVFKRKEIIGKIKHKTKIVPNLSSVCPKSVPRDIVFKILRKTQKSVTVTDLMNSMGQTNKTRFRQDILKPLIEAKLIVMTIPDKPQSSKQRYVITEKGRQLLKEMLLK